MQRMGAVITISWQRASAFGRSVRATLTDPISVGLTAVIGFVLAGLVVFTSMRPPHDYWMNLFTEMIGILATVGFLNELAKRREKQRWLEKMIGDASSTVQSVAVSSITALRNRDYLSGEESVLKGQNLSFANWHAAHLQNCCFDGADFSHILLDSGRLQHTSLDQVNLSHSNLSQSNLSDASLRQSELFQANLSGADLTYVDLTGARLIETDLRGCNLSGAVLKDAIVRRPICDASTILPNGREWNSQTHLRNFTQEP